MDIKTANDHLARWKEKNPPPTIEEVLEELRFEYEKTVEVYGAKAEKYRPHTRKRREGIRDLSRRLARLERAGAIIKAALNIGEQKNLF